MRLYPDQDPRDIAQAGWIGAIQASDARDGREHGFRAYAEKCVRGRIGDYLRLIDPLKRKHREDVKAGEAAPVTSGLELLENVGRDDASYLQADAELDCARLLSGLRPKSRAAVRSTFLEQRSAVQAAAVLSVSTDAVRLRVTGALKHARKVARLRGTRS